jgi:hypothetical protein
MIDIIYIIDNTLCYICDRLTPFSSTEIIVIIVINCDVLFVVIVRLSMFL